MTHYTLSTPSRVAAAFAVSLLALSCKARREDAQLKIVGGEAVSSRDYDFVVGIAERRDDGTYEVFCTGTVVAPKVVLTAAHCLEDLVAKPGKTPDLTRFRVMIGNDVEDKTAGAVTMLAVESAGRHESYEVSDTESETILKNDVGFVKLKDALPSGVTPVPIWTSGFKLGRFLQDNKASETRIVELVGYGRTGATETKTGVKRRVKTTILADSALAFDTIIVGDSETDACKGDSGGPAFVESDGVRYLVGVVSGATDFIKDEKGEKIYIICKGRTRTMRMTAYWEWLAGAAAITIEKRP